SCACWPIWPPLPAAKRPQDRVPLAEAKQAFRVTLQDYADSDGIQSAVDEGIAETFPASDPVAVEVNGTVLPEAVAPGPTRRRASSPTKVTLEDGTETEIDHGAV